MRIPLLMLSFFFLLSSSAFSQNGMVKGILQDNDTRSPLMDAQVSLIGTTTLTTQTSTLGAFEFKNGVGKDTENSVDRKIIRYKRNKLFTIDFITFKRQVQHV